MPAPPSESPPSWDCPCGARNPMTYAVCYRCGAGRSTVIPKNVPRVCIRCGVGRPPDAAFCAKCGQSFTMQPTPYEAPREVPASAGAGGIWLAGTGILWILGTWLKSYAGYSPSGWDVWLFGVGTVFFIAGFILIAARR